MKKIFLVAGINLLLLLPVLYGAEYFLRSRERVEPRDTYLRLGWKPLMPVWMEEVARLQGASRSSVLGGIPHQKTYLCDDGYGAVVYTSDHLGFRSLLADYLTGAPYDIVLVGDSFLHGWCHQVGLAEYLRGAGRRVVNTAIAGSHPYQYSSVIRQIIASPRPPRIAILGIYLGNDYGTCSGCEKRYSLANEAVERIYEYSPQLSRHVLRDRPETRAYFAALAALQDEKTKQLIGESTRQFLKLGELRRFLRGLFSMTRGTTVPRRSDFNPDVRVSPKPVEQSVVDLLRVCRAQNACKPILVTIPSNEPGESTGLRARIRAQHMKIIERSMAANPSVIHIDLERRDAGIRDCSYPLYDQPGRHLSPAGQRCMNEMVANAVH